MASVSGIAASDEVRAIELALTQFNQRSWKDHFLARSIAIAASCVLVWALVGPRWGALVAFAAVLGIFWDLYATRVLHRTMAEISALDATQAHNRRSTMIAVVAFGSAIYCLPYAALSLAPGPGPVLGMIFATGAISLIIGQHVLTRTMSLWTLPTAAIALSTNAMALAPGWVGVGCGILALVAAANAYSLTIASWRASQDLIEAQLKSESAAADLDHKIMLRTRDLATAVEQARLANDQKSAFLNAASHDLRQPLQAATAYLSVIESRAEGEISAIAAKALSALDVTNDILGALLDVSRLNAGVVEVRTKDFALANFLSRLQLQFENVASEKNLRFVSTTSPLTLRTDPEMLERVLANYLSNAIRYTSNGEVELGFVEKGAFARIFVRDTGVGIPTEKLTQIFDEFVQLENVARSRSHGYGLGLSVAKKVAALIECPIGVDSRLGEGSTFWIDVPITNTSPAPLKLVGAERKPQKLASVLLVEDDEMVAAATTMLLRDEGYDPRHVMSSAEAIEAIASGFQPDLIVSDFRLPDGYGLDLIRRLRAEFASRTPALLITGDTMLDTKDVEREGIHVLRKPVPPGVLFAALNKLATID